MPNITTCTGCGTLYEAGSEEQANAPTDRLCPSCRQSPPPPEWAFARKWLQEHADELEAATERARDAYPTLDHDAIQAEHAAGYMVEELMDSIKQEPPEALAGLDMNEVEMAIFEEVHEGLT